MSDRVGAIINKDIEVVKGRIGSFINNFMASANGCKMPYGPTMLGPFRSCMYPKILRSTNVRKAMAIRMGGRTVVAPRRHRVEAGYSHTNPLLTFL